MMYVVLSGLVLIRDFFEETYFCHLHANLLACFYKNYLKFILSHIYFHLDDFALCKQYQSVSEEIMEGGHTISKKLSRMKSQLRYVYLL